MAFQVNNSNMDYMKVAQLYNLASTENKKKYELLNQINIDYCITDNLLYAEKSLLGYTALHISVLKYDFDLVLELLTHGASVLKQGTLDKWTPLHLIFFNTPIEERMIWNASDISAEQRLIDILLKAHVNSGNTFNPISEEGVSHLHIACIFNHIQAVRILASGNSLNQATKSNSRWPGYTALHFAVKYSSVEAVGILIKEEADVHLKDAVGMSSLQLMIDRKISLIDSTALGTPVDRSSDEEKGILFYKAETDKIEQIIDLTLKANLIKNVDFSASAGLTILHVACIQKNTSLLQDILRRNIDVNLPIASDSPFWPGWTPLHFASLTSIEAVKLLIYYGADLNVKNTAGQTPLDFCLKKYSPIIIHSILTTNPEFQNILFTDRSTKLLDVILQMNNCYEFAFFLRTLDNINICVTLDSPLWPGYSLLHLVVRMSCTKKNWYSDTTHQALMCWGILTECLTARCSLTMKNSDGQSPIHLAFYLSKPSIVADLIAICEEDSVDPNGLSHLHIACTLAHPSAVDAVKKLCGRGIKINAPLLNGFYWHNEPSSEKIRVHSNSTPLHIAVIFKNEEVVRCLLANGADVYAKNSVGLTPIHLSMTSTPSISRLLLENAPNLRDYLTENRLSYLHVAAFANDDLVIRKLLRNGARSNVFIQSSKDEFLSQFTGNTPLHVAVKSNSDKAVRELLRFYSDIDGKNPNDPHDSPIDYITRNLSSDCVEYFIIQMKPDKNRIFRNGITTLHFACSRFDHKWARQLLEMRADPNARVCDDENYVGPWKGFTPLRLLIERAKTEKDETKYLAGMVELLMKHGADPLIPDCQGGVPVVDAFDMLFELFEEEEECDEVSDRKMTWGSVVNMLFDGIKNYNVDPPNEDGLTLFHLACMKNKACIVKQFLDSGVDVNLRTDPFGKYKGYSPLHVAFLSSSKEVARLLIQCGADVKAEDVDGNTPLHFAVRWTNMKDAQLVQMLLSRGADPTAKNLNGQSPIDCHLKSKFLTKPLLEFLHQHGSKVDISRMVSDEGFLGLAMKYAYLNDRQSIFDTLVEICNLKSAIADGFNAIHSLVSLDHNGEIGRRTYLSCIKQLLEIGCELDQQDEEGKTALHKAVYYRNANAVLVLSMHLGADINIVDKSGNTPFTTPMVPTKPNDTYNRFLRATIFHLLNLHFVGLYVHGANVDLINDALDNDATTVDKWKELIQEDLAKMNSIQIGESLSLGDFMSELKAVAAYPRMMLWKRQIVDYYFNCTNDLHKAFPRLGGLLLLQLRKARARSSLIGRAKIVMYSVWVVRLPDLCSEKILSYLINDELKLLIGDEGNVCNPCKRRRFS